MPGQWITLGVVVVCAGVAAYWFFVKNRENLKKAEEKKPEEKPEGYSEQKINEFMNSLSVALHKEFTWAELEKRPELQEAIKEDLKDKIDFYWENFEFIDKFNKGWKRITANPVKKLGTQNERMFKEWFESFFSDEEKEFIDYEEQPRAERKAADVKITFYQDKKYKNLSKQLFSVIIELKTHFDEVEESSDTIEVVNKRETSAQKIIKYTRELFKKYKGISHEYNLFLLVTDEDWKKKKNDKRAAQENFVWFLTPESYMEELNIEKKEANSFINGDPGPKFAIASPAAAIHFLKDIFYLFYSRSKCLEVHPENNLTERELMQVNWRKVAPEINRFHCSAWGEVNQAIEKLLELFERNIAEVIKKMEKIRDFKKGRKSQKTETLFDWYDRLEVNRGKINGLLSENYHLLALPWNKSENIQEMSVVEPSIESDGEEETEQNETEHKEELT